MLHFEASYDISLVLGQEVVTYPGDTPFSRRIICEISDGCICCTSRLLMSAHSGTHLDMPSHFIADGKTVDNYQVDSFTLSAQVVETGKPVQASDLMAVDIHPGEALLFKTDNSMTGKLKTGAFSNHSVYLTPEAADLCVEKQVRLVGIDYMSVDNMEDKTFPVHRTLLENNILILESINLHEVPSGRYTLVCLPLKIKGGEASPVRAVLLR